MKIIEVDQLSPEWYDAKRGVPSASNFNRIFKAKSGGLSDSCDSYIAELVAEHDMMLPKVFSVQKRPITPDMIKAKEAMDRGLELEPKARSWYERMTGYRVYPVGFCTTDDGRWGCSPDGMIDPNGLVEIKIYGDEQHAKWAAAGVVPNLFKAQLHGQLLTTGRQWVDLVLWSETQESKIIRTVPDATTRALRVALEMFHTRYTAALLKAGITRGEKQ